MPAANRGIAQIRAKDVSARPRQRPRYWLVILFLADDFEAAPLPRHNAPQARIDGRSPAADAGPLRSGGARAAAEPV
jgi:hypothetical protein